MGRVMCCSYTFQHLPLAFSGQRSVQQVLWPDWSLSALGRDDFAQSLLWGHWLCWSPPFPPAKAVVLYWGRKGAGQGGIEPLGLLSAPGI